MQSSGFVRAVRSDGFWVAVVGADFFLFSNPEVFWGYSFSFPLAIAITVAAMLTSGAARVRGSWLILALTAYLALGWLSRFWTVNPTRTLPEVLKFTLIAVVALIVAVCASARAIAAGVAAGAVAITVASMVAAALDMHGARGRTNSTHFNGVGTNANILAYCLVLGLALTLAFFPRNRVLRIPWAISVLLIVIGLYLSDSRTGWVAAAVLLAIGGLLVLCASARVRVARVFQLATATLLCAFLALTLLLPFVLRWIRPDGSLNFGSRLQIWDATMQVAGDRPLLGYGWGAVWPKGWESHYSKGQDTSVVTRIREIAQVKSISHGHNSAYDLLAQLGWIGVGLFCLLMLAAIWTGWALIRMPGGYQGPAQQMGRVGVLGVAAVLVIGQTEPIISIPLGWFVFVMTAGAAANWLVRSTSPERRLRAQPERVGGGPDDAVGPDDPTEHIPRML